MITTLTRWRQNFVRVNHHYPHPVDRQRARLLLYFLWVLFFTGAAALFLVVPAFLRQQSLRVASAGIIGLTIVIPILMVAVQRGYLRLASWLLVLILLAASLLPSLNGIQDIRSIIIMLPLVIAGMLLNWQGILITLLIAIGITLVGWSNSFDRLPPTSANALIIDGLVLLITVIISGLFLLIFNTRLTLLPPRFAEELQQLRLFAGLNLFARDTDTEASLSNRVVDMLCGAGGYAFARVFLLDESGTKIDQIFAGSGLVPVGQPTELEVDSAMRDVILTRQITLVDSSQAAPRRAHLLPGSAAGLLLPLTHEGTFIGILDVQTVRSAGFSAGEQTSLAMLAERLSHALSHWRYIAFQTQTLQDQQATIQRQRDRLQQLERADQQAVINAWSAYLEQRGQRIFGYDVDETTLEPRPASDMPVVLQQTLAQGEIVVEQSDEQQVIGVPITLRGQVVGGISFALPKNRPVTQRQKEMIVSVVQRLALALDNKRLFEQSQTQAQRESKANEIARLLLTSTDVETVLQLAASTFNETLGAVQTRIYLNPTIQAAAEEVS